MYTSGSGPSDLPNEISRLALLNQSIDSWQLVVEGQEERRVYLQALLQNKCLAPYGVYLKSNRMRSSIGLL